MSPRRSSRARLSQSLNNHSSSSSSVTSNLQDRSSRAHIDQNSKMKSATPQSESDGVERSQPPEPEARQTRRQKREQDTLDGSNDKPVDGDVDPEDGEEEEVTRCVCGQVEYPGPPVPAPENNTRSHQAKDSLRATSQTATDPLQEEPGSLFIQCDECYVWQHGGCVGIMDEATCPDNYYCEECRPDLHKVVVGTRGQNYSKYLPVFEALQVKTARRSSGTNGKESHSRSAKENDIPGGTAAMAMSSAKRRSTMNSRAAIEEEEAFLKAIEESKGGGSSMAAALKAKRGREESEEEIKQDIKRLKTGSESDTPTVAQADSAIPSDSEAARVHGASNNGRRRARGTTGSAPRERDTREREREKERERAENAARRKGRGDKRRADAEPERLEETPRHHTSSRTGASAKQSRSQAAAKGSPNPAVVPQSNSAQKKATKNGTRRGRAGRNQYTKDRDAAGESKGGSPQAPQSRESEEMGNSDSHGGANAAGVPNSGILGNGTKPSKPRHMNPNRTSMNDLRKRAAGILEYISRTQVEMAGEKTPPQQKGDEGSPVPGRAVNGSRTRSRGGTQSSGLANGESSKLSNHVESIAEDETREAPQDDAGGEDDGESREKDGNPPADEAGFRDLSSLKMMDVLTRELMLWQKEHGKWGEK